jgi:alkylation response protein AidB-like acyl-CoA dehydrogenase
MNFQFTEDQQAFAESARKLFEDHCSDEQLRAHDRSSEPFRQALWQACIENGLHAVLVPEAAGGIGMGMAELMAVLEAQGRALALVPLWEHQLAAATVARFGQASAQSRVLPAAMSGSEMLTLSLAGLTEAHAPRLHLSRSAQGLHLQGRAHAVPLAAQAPWVLLCARLDGADRLALVPTHSATQTPGRSQHHLAVADLVFDHVALPEDALLAPAALAWLEPRAIAALAALQVGVSAAQLARTVTYISERKQFGRPIGSFQLVAGQMADGYIALEALRSALWQLVYRLDAGLHAQPQALGVRVLACEGAHRTGHMAQHVHGGMGVDLTYPIHRYLYWSRALSTQLGGAEAHLARLGDWLADNDALGWKYDGAEPALP